jgi:hypothetical protein
MSLLEFIASGGARLFPGRKKTGIDTESNDSSRKTQWKEAYPGVKG